MNSVVGIEDPKAWIAAFAPLMGVGGKEKQAPREM